MPAADFLHCSAAMESRSMIFRGKTIEQAVQFARIWRRRTARGSLSGMRRKAGLIRNVLRLAATPALAAAILAAPAAMPLAAQEASEPSREYLIKAAFLYNFALFTTWPQSSLPRAGSPLVFCVLGDDPFGVALGSIAGKTIRGHKIAIARISDDSRAGDCHLLFISKTEAEGAPALVRTLERRPILTVAEFPDFAQEGGMIRLKTRDGKVRFEISRSAVAQSGLQLSSKLLELSEIVPQQSARPASDVGN